MEEGQVKMIYICTHVCTYNFRMSVYCNESQPTEMRGKLKILQKMKEESGLGVKSGPRFLFLFSIALGQSSLKRYNIKGFGHPCQQGESKVVDCWNFRKTLFYVF